MNPTVLAMSPGITNNQLQQSNQASSNSIAKFGTVLENTILNNQVSTTSDSGQTELSIEQINTIKDLLTFLKMNGLTDLHEGKSSVEKLLMDENYSGKDELLQLLKKVNGEGESVVAELLADISNLGLSLSDEDKKVDSNNSTNQLFIELLSDLPSILKEQTPEKNTSIASSQAIDGSNQPAKKEALFTIQELAQLLSNQTPEKNTSIDSSQAVDASNQSAKIEDALMNKKLTQVNSDTPSVIYPILKNINSLDVKDLATLDLNSTADVLKLAKLQDLLSVHKDLSQDAALLQKEIKDLLEKITSKLETWLGSQPTKSGNEATFATLLENGTNKSIDVVKQVYAQLLKSDAETSDDNISKGLTLKTAESNTQSSGLPFQMTKLEQYVLTASKNGQPVDAEQFVRAFESILSKANFSKTNGVQKLLIRLNPENLGSLRIELIQKDGAMVAKILATTAQAKELLDRQLQGLKHSFTNQNIQIDKIEVSQQISTFNSERFASRNHEQNEHQQQQQPQNNKEKNENEENDFTDRFTEALVNLEV